MAQRFEAGVQSRVLSVLDDHLRRLRHSIADEEYDTVQQPLNASCLGSSNSSSGAGRANRGGPGAALEAEAGNHSVSQVTFADVEPVGVYAEHSTRPSAGPVAAANASVVATGQLSEEIASLKREIASLHDRFLESSTAPAPRRRANVRSTRQRSASPRTEMRANLRQRSASPAAPRRSSSSRRRTGALAQAGVSARRTSASPARHRAASQAVQAHRRRGASLSPAPRAQRRSRSPAAAQDASVATSVSASSTWSGASGRVNGGGGGGGAGGSTVRSVRTATRRAAQSQSELVLEREVQRLQRLLDQREYELMQERKESAALRARVEAGEAAEAALRRLESDYDELRISLDQMEAVRQQQKRVIASLRASRPGTAQAAGSAARPGAKRATPAVRHAAKHSRQQGYLKPRAAVPSRRTRLAGS